MFFAVCIILLIFPREAATGAAEGMRTAFETVIVSILPFAVFSSATILSGGAVRAAKATERLWRKLRLNPYGAIAFFAGLLGGYPTGCGAVCDLYREKAVTKSEAEKLLAYVNNGGIVFALNVCGAKYFLSVKEGAVIFAASAAAALLSGMLLTGGEYGKIEKMPEKKPPMRILGKSIASAGGTAMNILASFIVTYAISNALRLEKIPILQGLAEMTKGMAYAGKKGDTALASMLFSFGGMGVFAQSAALCAEFDLKMGECLKGKVVAAALSYVIAGALKSAAQKDLQMCLTASAAIAMILGGVKAIKIICTPH